MRVNVGTCRHAWPQDNSWDKGFLEAGSWNSRWQPFLSACCRSRAWAGNIKNDLNSDESVGFGPLLEPTECFGTRSRAWAGNIKDELNSDESVGFGPLLEPTECFGTT